MLSKHLINSRFYLIALLVAAGLFSCTKEDREAQVLKQDQNIDAFISKTKADTVLYRGGTCRVILKTGIGDTLCAGDSVIFRYAGHIFSNGKGQLFTTNHDSIALSNGLAITEQSIELGRNIVGAGRYIQGLDLGLTGCRLNEHSYILFNSDLGFGNNPVGIVPKMSPLLFEVWIDNIVKQ